MQSLAVGHDSFAVWRTGTGTARRRLKTFTHIHTHTHIQVTGFTSACVLNYVVCRPSMDSAIFVASVLYFTLFTGHFRPSFRFSF